MYEPDGVGGPLCMECLEWLRGENCYWCGCFHLWMHTPIEIGRPLCWWCETKFHDPADNQPHRPHAIDRQVLELAECPYIPPGASDLILWKIAESLVSKWEP